MTTIFSTACDRETGWPLERVLFALAGTVVLLRAAGGRLLPLVPPPGGVRWLQPSKGCPTASTAPPRSPPFCSSGQRSAVAASLRLRHGADNVIHVADGGVGTWEERGWPIEQPEPTATRR
jgi:hypothetical protein